VKIWEEMSREQKRGAVTYAVVPAIYCFTMYLEFLNCSDEYWKTKLCKDEVESNYVNIDF
jgi:hypothetical protein